MAYRIAVFINETRKLSAETACIVGVKDVATEFVHGPENCTLADLQSHIENMLIAFPDKLKEFKENEEAKKNSKGGKDKKEEARKEEVKAVLDARPAETEKAEENMPNNEPELPLVNPHPEPENALPQEVKAEPIAVEECNPEDLF